MISGGLLSVATIALTLAGADARPKGGFKHFAKHLTRGDSHSTHTFSTSGKTSSSAKVHCSSGGYAETYSIWENSYIKAVTDVVVEVCNPDFTGSTIKATDKLTGFAKAWAQATAETAARCETSVSGGGKASGCAYASASAKAFEKAFASAHASASAEAFAKHCKCANAAAWDFGDASVFHKLAAKAYAEAESRACASGNDISIAAASVECQAHIFAQTYAFAAAEASVAGKCHGKSGKAKASAEIKAEVDAQVYDNSKCAKTTKQTGLASNKVKTSVKSSSKIIHKGNKGKGKGRK